MKPYLLFIEELNANNTIDDLFSIDEKNGKWFINPLWLSSSDHYRGRPFNTKEKAIQSAISLVPYYTKELKKIKKQKELMDKRQQLSRNKQVDDIADQNIIHERDPIEGDSDNILLPGDVEYRVVYDIKKGQDIPTNDLTSIGVVGNSHNVFGIHVGDPDYWKQRLNKDYDRKNGKVIKIIFKEGDRLLEDNQYMTDPDSGEKAYSAIILTSRKVLKYGLDWTLTK